jgi:hypothetical protein
VRHRPGDQQYIGVARRRHEPDAEALDVVDRVGEGVDLEFAAVARAGIERPNSRRTRCSSARPTSASAPSPAAGAAMVAERANSDFSNRVRIRRPGPNRSS